MEPITTIQLGINLGAVGAVLTLLASGRLVARSWADAVVKQANMAAQAADLRAERAEARADEAVRLMTEQTAALRAVQALVQQQNYRGGAS